MARFRSRPTDVEAEPYRPELEDEFTGQPVLVVVTPAGRRAFALGDWIVSKTTGERQVVKAEVFESLYERCPSDQRAQTSERVKRGIPMRSG